MKKDDNHDAMLGMKEDEHDESVGITCTKRHRDTSSNPRSLKNNERVIPCYSKDHQVVVDEDRVIPSMAAQKAGSTTPRQ